MTIFILSVVGVVISITVGTFWYSTATPMGRLHLKSLGFDKLSKKEQQKKMEGMKPMMLKMYGMQAILSMITSVAVVFIVTLSLRNGIPFYYALGFIVFNWLGFAVPSIGIGILWGTVDRKIALQKFISDSLSNLTTLVLIALVTSFFV